MQKPTEKPLKSYPFTASTCIPVYLQLLCRMSLAVTLYPLTGPVRRCTVHQPPSPAGRWGCMRSWCPQGQSVAVSPLVCTAECLPEEEVKPVSSGPGYLSMNACNINGGDPHQLPVLDNVDHIFLSSAYILSHSHGEKCCKVPGLNKIWAGLGMRRQYKHLYYKQNISQEEWDYNYKHLYYSKCIRMSKSV